MEIFDDVVAAIGNTPLVRLSRLHPAGNLVAKIEYMNPGGSIKERIALSMIEQAERDGLLKPGGTIVEPTSGNTGVGLAMVGVIRGYRVICTVPDKVSKELDERLRADLRRPGDFARIHPVPRSGADVPDDLDARLVVLPAEHPYSKEPGNAAETAARAILESRGNTPRLYRNTLVFLAADKVRLQDLDEAVRRFLAWESIVADKDTLNLDQHQMRQADIQMRAADGAVTARLPEAYQWLLVPEQVKPDVSITWQAIRLSGSDALAVRASKRLRSDELLLTSLGSTILRKHLDDVLWRGGNHVAIRQLIEDFARPRSRSWFWRQALLAVAVSGFRDRREVRRFPLGITELPGQEPEVQRIVLPASINITASPIPHVGGLGLVTLIGLMVAVRPEVAWLVLFSVAVGIVLGVTMAAVRRRRVLAAPDGPPARLFTC